VVFVDHPATAAVEDALLDATIQAVRSASPPHIEIEAGSRSELTPGGRDTSAEQLPGPSDASAAWIAPLRLLLQPGPVAGSGVSPACEARRGVWQHEHGVHGTHWQDQRGGVGDYYCRPSAVAFSCASEVAQRCLMSREAIGAASLPRPLKFTSSSTRREVPTADGLKL
jgi:hypothetical protein